MDGNEARYATAVVQVWGSQVCMGQYIQKRLNSGQGEGRLKAAGGRTEIGRPLWHWALALLPVPAAAKPRLAGFIFTREENDEIRKIYRRSLSHSLVKVLLTDSLILLLADDILLASHRAPLIAARHINRTRTTVGCRYTDAGTTQNLHSRSI